MEPRLRRTKIICSINENSSNIDLLRQMIQAGGDAFSVNMAYVRQRDELKKINEIRNQLELEFEKKIPVNVILRGLIVRVGQFQEPEITLKQGSYLYLTSQENFIGSGSIISIQSPDFFQQVRVNDELGLDYGQIKLHVHGIKNSTDIYPMLNIPQPQSPCMVLECECLNEGQLRPFKPVFIIQREARKQSIEFTGQINTTDETDLDFSMQCQFDSVTLACVTEHSEIFEARRQTHGHMQIYARIAHYVSCDEAESIIAASDGCIIARSYISMCQSLEDVVKLQHFIIMTCRKLFKPVFISTQVLESMIMAAKPTLAEISDVYSVVRQHIDGIMLSGETSYGRHPIDVINTLDSTCKNIERQMVNVEKDPHFHILDKPIASVIAQSAVEMARILPASAIILMTVTLGTTLKISKMRTPCAIIAVTQKEAVSRALQYVNGVCSNYVKNFDCEEEYFIHYPSVINQTIEKAKRHKLIFDGEYVVVMSGDMDQYDNEWHINQMKIVKI